MVDAYHELRGEAPPAPTGCPVNHEWSPLDSDYLDDPYPIAADLLDETPVFYAESLGYVVVNEMDDILEVFTNPEVYSSEIVQDPVFPVAASAAEVLAAPDYNPQKVMSNRQAPDHGRIRKYTRKGFSRRRLTTLEPYIRRRSNELIDEMVRNRGDGDAPVEFIESFAFPLPGETVFRFIGFPEADDEILKQWCSDRKQFSWGRADEDEQAAIAEKMVAYWRYCRQFTAAKMTDRGDDFASELLADHEANPDDLTYREVESILYGLSFAGHEAVTALICNSLICLLPRRDQWDALVADPSLIPNAVEEVLRFESSQVSWRRITTQDTVLRGVALPAGTRVFLNFASANRQGDLFEQPNDFDIHRPNAGHHISFGKGMHYCLGANLAKFETALMLEALSQRLPSLKLADDQALQYSPNITFRGPQGLLVEW